MDHSGSNVHFMSTFTSPVTCDRSSGPALSPSMGSVVLVLTVVMCLCSGALAIRRVLRLDPAELF